MSLHAKISYFKSGIRIIGFILLPFTIGVSALILIIAELLGIIEELYERK